MGAVFNDSRMAKTEITINFLTTISVVLNIIIYLWMINSSLIGFVHSVCCHFCWQNSLFYAFRIHFPEYWNYQILFNFFFVASIDILQKASYIYTCISTDTLLLCNTFCIYHGIPLKHDNDELMNGICIHATLFDNTHHFAYIAHITHEHDSQR